MANGLMGLSSLLGQSSNATSGGFLGGPSIFSNAPSRGQQRSRLLTDLISGAGSDPYARLGAAFGGLIGMGGRAAAEGLGIVDQPEEVRRNNAIREVQQLVSQRGLDPLDPGFGEFVAEEFQRRGFGDLATRSLLQHRQLQSQFAPQQPEVENVRTVETEQGIRVIGTLGNQVVDLTSGQLITDPLTPAQREESQSQREKTVDYYIGQGLEPRLANDLANGMIVQQVNPFTEETELVNLTGGPVPNSIPQGVTVPVRNPETGTITAPQENQAVQQTPEVRERQGLIENPLEVGLGPWLKEGVARSVGQFIDSANYPEVTQARTRLRSGRQFLISAWATSGRPPLIEQERIEANIPNLGAFESPARARVQLETLTEDLLEQRKADLRDIEDTSIAPQIRREVQRRVNATDRMLRLIDPRALETGEPTMLSDFSPREAQSALEQNIQNGSIPENATFGAYDEELEGYPIIVDGVPLTNEQGQLLVIRK